MGISQKSELSEMGIYHKLYPDNEMRRKGLRNGFTVVVVLEGVMMKEEIIQGLMTDSGLKAGRETGIIGSQVIQIFLM
jgi:hypothetical protein